MLKYLKRYRLECICAPLFKMFEATLELLVPLVVASIIDRGIGGGSSGHIWRMSGLLILLGLTGLAASITAQYFAARAATGFSADVRHALFKRLTGLAFSDIDHLGASAMITRMTSDVNQAQTGVNMVLRLVLRSPFVVFGAMVMAFTIDTRIALIFLIVIAVLMAVTYAIMALNIPMMQGVQRQLEQVLASTRVSLAGARVIRAFRREDAEYAEFVSRNRELTRRQLKAGRISALLNPLTYVIINIAVIALVRQGAVRVDSGILSRGQVVALYNYMSQILVELIKFAALIITINKAWASWKRVKDMLDMTPAMADVGEAEAGETAPSATLNATAPLGTTPSVTLRVTAPSKREPERAASTPKGSLSEGVGWPSGQTEGVLSEGAGWPSGQTEGVPTPAVQFDHVSLTYPGAGSESLTDIDFTALPGQTIGIIGGTGSGKSSIAGLIPRFYDVTAGRVLVDGVDVRAYPQAALRQKVGIVLQKAALFKGTLRDNLRWGRPDATDDELMAAVRTAQAAEVAEAKGGLDGMIEQNGANLSGGQRQRLTIARALVRRPGILILDDSASALDMATDARLRAAIAQLDYRPTVFIISQRAASIMRADQILVLDDGRLAGKGTHGELMARCSIYREIYESQFGGGEVHTA